MTETLYAQGALGSAAGLLAAGLIGLLFGFWLERAGFGSSRKLAAIFYLRDFAVLKVMFTAIVTALLGLHVLAAAGAVDLAALHRSETFLWPQLVGGLVFGAGFVIGGWCPGTALVGLASGKLDALLFLAGAGAGSLLFAALYPALEPFATAGACGVSTWPEALGLGAGTATALVVAMALGAFALAERVEAAARRRDAAAHQQAVAS